MLYNRCSDTEFACPNLLVLSYWPADILSKKCEAVTVFDDVLKSYVVDMVHTMLYNDGIGLASPQVGYAVNIIIINEEQGGDFTPLTLINPVLESINSVGLHTEREGCLSVPGYYEQRSRPSDIKVNYLDVDGIGHTKKFNGLNAFVVQHEIDHLNGNVFVDGMSNFKTRRVLNKIKKNKRK